MLYLRITYFTARLDVPNNKSTVSLYRFSLVGQSMTSGPCKELVSLLAQTWVRKRMPRTIQNFYAASTVRHKVNSRLKTAERPQRDSKRNAKGLYIPFWSLLDIATIPWPGYAPFLLSDFHHSLKSSPSSAKPSFTYSTPGCITVRREIHPVLHF